ncbi:MAG: UDP-N-acetylglucosamine--N-acetylmuramyl-(pentapeptide) pyrophosphoryl-undecaprenol N-acetylglucosamine transferase [Patescibacteria group bacterium]
MPENVHPYQHIKALLTGGGSGGHVYPLLAVAERLRGIAAAENIDLDLNYLGPKDEWISSLAVAHVGLGTIVSGKFRRYFSIENIFDIPKFFIGLFEALFKIYFIMPDVIFSKGGTGALSVVLAGWFYKIPIIIHESDAIPGLTNSISSRFASRIAVSFPKTLEYFHPGKTAFAGTPVRKAVVSDIPEKAAAKERLGFDPAKPLTLILGGSQGAQRVNEFIITNLPTFLKETQIFHQTGTANYKNVEYLSRVTVGESRAGDTAKRMYIPVPYLNQEEVKVALAAADLVIARSGSGTIAEISAFGKPSILIPLTESANDHQRMNAYEYSKTGAAIVIEENNLLPAILADQIKSIVQNPMVMERMNVAAKNLFKPDAAEAIAREILRLGG